MIDWIEKHKSSTHVIAVIFAGLVASYSFNPGFHKLVTQLWDKLPSWASVLILEAWWLYSWYRNGQKPPAGVFPIGVANAQGSAAPRQSFHAMIRGAGSAFRALPIAGLLALLITGLVTAPLIITTTGCTSSQFIAGIQDVEAKLPQIAEIAGGLFLVLDPEYVPAVQPAITALRTVGNTLVDLVTAYKKNPSNSGLQKINAAVEEGVSQVNQLANVVAHVKNPHSLGLIQGAAGLIALIFNDVASWAQNLPPAIISQLPAMFGWHIAGIDLIAIDGSQLPAPAAGKAKHSGFTARDIAAHWNKLAGKNEKAKIPETRKRVMGIPVPGTGHK